MGVTVRGFYYNYVKNNSGKIIMSLHKMLIKIQRVCTELLQFPVHVAVSKPFTTRVVFAEVLYTINTCHFITVDGSFTSYTGKFMFQCRYLLCKVGTGRSARHILLYYYYIGAHLICGQDVTIINFAIRVFQMYYRQI